MPLQTMQTQELQKKIGAEIKKLRLVNEWTQEQVAEQLHICRNTYGDIELGKTDICLSCLAQIANFFGVDIGYLVDDKEKVVFYLTGRKILNLLEVDAMNITFILRKKNCSTN
jgi:transcriptional regulator with XRE-family HTH domain